MAGKGRVLSGFKEMVEEDAEEILQGIEEVREGIRLAHDRLNRDEAHSQDLEFRLAKLERVLRMIAEEYLVEKLELDRPSKVVQLPNSVTTRRR